MPTYVCTQCGKEYPAMTADGFCTNQPDCEYGTGWLREVGAETAPGSPAPLAFDNEAGLCVLMMDGSLSMNEPAFPESDYPGTRYKLVAMNAAGGIWSLKAMTHLDQAYIALCVFAGKPKLIWVKSVQQILEDFSSPDAFGDFIQETLETQTPEPRFTNINEAVQMAHRITRGFIRGDLSEYGGPRGFKPLMHSVVRSGEGGEAFIDIPNVRVLIYTDGEHNVTAAIKNPFAQDEQSVLISAFIGEEDAKGVRQMQSIACTCPRHAPARGFFLIHSPERVQTLRGLFRMASGASGFCAACLQLEQKALEEPAPAPEETAESATSPETARETPLPDPAEPAGVPPEPG